MTNIVGKSMASAHARRYPRLTVRVRVEYSVAGESFRCLAQTLSGGGLFLTEVQGLEPGMEISVRFRPAKHLPLIQAKARVLYLWGERGAGVEFTEISTADRQVLLRRILQQTGDRRRLPRVHLATQVEFEQCMSLAFSRDISLGGMFIETTSLLPVGSPLTVRFNLDYKDRVVTALGRVAYQIEKMGMGIFFTNIEPKDSEAIREYVESLQNLPRTEPTPCNQTK